METPPIQILAGLTLALGSTVIGYSGAFTSPVLPKMKNESFLVDDDVLGDPDEQASWIGSLMSLFAMVGGIIGGPLIEILGRKKTLIGIAIPTATCYLIIGFAQNVYMVYAGRIIKGFCVGVLSLTTPVYLGEVIEPRIRGTMGVLPATFGNGAMLICYVAGMYVSWNALAFIGACLPIPLFILMMFIPETPRWYLSKGRHNDAVAALSRLRSKTANIEGEIAEIEHNIQESKKHEGGIKDLLQRAYVKALMVSLGLMLFQQMSGINAVIAYTVDIFKAAGSTMIDENIATCIVGVVNILSTIASNILIDRLGRKVLLFISGTGMSITLIVLGVYFHLKGQDEESVATLGWLPLLCLVFYVISFSLGFGPIPWLMLGEIFPNRIRGKAASVAAAFNWAMSFIVTKTYFTLEKTLGTNGVFYLYGCICVVAIVFTGCLVPETKGKSLEDIERQLAKTASFIKREKAQKRAEANAI